MKRGVTSGLTEPAPQIPTSTRKPNHMIRPSFSLGHLKLFPTAKC